MVDHSGVTKGKRMGIGSSLPSFEYDIAFGRARGHFPIAMIGNIEDQSNGIQHVVWDYTDNDITFLSSGEVVYASSSNLSDVGCVLIVSGVDDDWSSKVEVITLNGQTPVEVGVFRVVNSAVIQTQGAVGNVYIYTEGTATAGVPSGSSLVQNYIRAGKNITRSCFYGVPLGYGFAVTVIRGGTDSPSKATKVRSYIRFEGQPDLQTVSYYILPSFTQYFFPSPIASTTLLSNVTPVLPEKTIVYYTAESSTANTDVFFGVDGVLVDLREYGGQ